MPLIVLEPRPGGTACDHVIIKTSLGRRLRVTTIPELRTQVTRKDDYLLAQIKRMARESGLTNLTQLRNYLESKDFDYDD
jgi:hypothetical protein